MVRPPTSSAATHTNAMPMITTRSSLLSNGRWTGRLAESNGTSHSITRNAASIHGRTRVVCGQAPPSAIASCGTATLTGCARSVGAGSPTKVSPALIARASDGSSP